MGKRIKKKKELPGVTLWYHEHLHGKISLLGLVLVIVGWWYPGMA